MAVLMLALLVLLGHDESVMAHRNTNEDKSAVAELAHKSASFKHTSLINSILGTSPIHDGKWRYRPSNEKARDALVQLTKELVSQAGNYIVDCQKDDTLPESLPKGKYLIALNLRNNQHVLPHIIVELIHLIIHIDRDTEVFLSVYESGSTDNTVPLLHVLKDVLHGLRVPHRILAGSSDSWKHMTEAGKKMDRIVFLANMRNRALEPLWPINEHTPEPLDFRSGGMPGAEGEVAAAAPTSRKLREDGTTEEGEGEEEEEEEAVGGRKLHLRHRSFPHITDAMKHKLVHDQMFEGIARQQQGKAAQLKQEAGEKQGGAGQSQPAAQQVSTEDDLGPLDFAYHHSTMASLLHMPALGFPADRVIFMNDGFSCARDIIRLASHTDADIACGMDFWAYGDKAVFFDTWVARDLAGGILGNKTPEKPYSTHEPTSSRMARGLPVPVYSCWNGMVVMNAAPFREGLRMRSHAEGECAASECTLLADDFWRMGYGKVVMDPWVRLVYQETVGGADKLWDPAFPGFVPVATWGEAVKEPINWSDVRRPMARQCCEMHGNDVVWGDCFDYDPFATNYTDVAIKSGFKPSARSVKYPKSK